MDTPELYVVTGSLGYTGRYITRRLLSRGIRVKTQGSSGKGDYPFNDVSCHHQADRYLWKRRYSYKQYRLVTKEVSGVCSSRLG